MSAVLICLAEEESWWVLLLISLVVLVLIGVCVGVLVWLLRELAWNSRQGRSIGDLEFRVGERTLAARNLGMLLVVVGVVFAIPIATVVLMVLAYDELSSLHAVGFDTPTAKISLDEVRQSYQGETNLTILLAPDIKTFEVTGSFSGACVADLFDSICRKYPDRLSCSTSWTNSTITVKGIAGP